MLTRTGSAHNASPTTCSSTTQQQSAYTHMGRNLLHPSYIITSTSKPPHPTPSNKPKPNSASPPLRTRPVTTHENERTDELSNHSRRTPRPFSQRSRNLEVSSRTPIYWARRFTDLSKQAQVISSQAEASVWLQRSSPISAAVWENFSDLQSCSTAVLWTPRQIGDSTVYEERELLKAARSILVETRRAIPY